MNPIVRWFLRWLGWVYFTHRELFKDDDMGQDATFITIFSLVIGILCVVTPIISLSIIDGMTLWWEVVFCAVCFVLYMVTGFALSRSEYFWSSHQPWYKNGIWS